MPIGDFLTSLLTDFVGQLLSPLTAALAIAAIGLNLHFGYTGLINIGQAGFMLAGGAGFAVTVMFTGNFWLGLLVGVVLAIVFALLLGLPSLWLRGDYFSMITIAAAEMLRMIADNTAMSGITGGPLGILGSKFQPSFSALSPFPQQGSWSLGVFSYPLSQGDSWWLRIVTWSVLIIITVVIWLLVKSPWGRVLRGIREDEDAMRSLGKHVNLIKTQSLVIGGVIGAIGGVFYVLDTSFQADSLGRNTTYLLYTCLFVGGAATVFGPILGTAIYLLSTTFLRDLMNAYIPNTVMSSTQVPEAVWVLVGVGLMLVVIFRPQGILGNKREITFIG